MTQKTQSTDFQKVDLDLLLETLEKSVEIFSDDSYRFSINNYAVECFAPSCFTRPFYERIIKGLKAMEQETGKEVLFYTDNEKTIFYYFPYLS